MGAIIPQRLGEVMHDHPPKSGSTQHFQFTISVGPVDSLLVVRIAPDILETLLTGAFAHTKTGFPPEGTALQCRYHLLSVSILQRCKSEDTQTRTRARDSMCNHL